MIIGAVKVFRYDSLKSFLNKFLTASDYRLEQGKDISKLIEDVFKVSKKNINIRNGSYINEFGGNINKVKYVGATKDGESFIYFEAEYNSKERVYNYARIIRKEGGIIKDTILGNEDEDDRVVTQKYLDRIPPHIKGRVSKVTGVKIK